MGGDANQTKASKQSKAGVANAEMSRNAILNDPMRASAASFVQQLIANPFTLTPIAVDAMNQQGISEANAGANAFLNDRMTQLSGMQGAPGYRSGSARDAEYEAAARLGEGLASAHRQTQITQATQRIPDLVNAINQITGFVGQRFPLDQAVTNARMGAASNFVSMAGQPSDLERGVSAGGQFVSNVNPYKKG